jgi:hypothetical protein
MTSSIAYSMLSGITPDTKEKAMSDEKVRENRLRRMAERQGLRLVKSRRRDPLALDYQLYALISEDEYQVAGGWQKGGRFGFTLDEVEARLSKGTRGQR